MSRNNVFEFRTIELGNGLIARIEWEYDEDGCSSFDWLGEFVPHQDEYTIDRVEGVFLGKSVDGFFRISLSALGIRDKVYHFGGWDLSFQDWEKVENEAQRRLEKLKVWVDDNDLRFNFHDTNPNLIELSYDGYELLAGGLGRTCWDSPRYYRYYKPSSNYCPPENADEVRYCIEDWKRMEAFNDGDWCMTGCVVTILADGGVELGHASIWGVESDCGDDYKREIERDELWSALEDAKKNVGKVEKQAETLHEIVGKLRVMDVNEAMEMFEGVEVDS